MPRSTDTWQNYSKINYMKNKQDILKQIKNMDTPGLNSLASDIRKDMVQYVSRSGGHLASSLGVVELTLAVHKVFDSPNDKIIWDVGHQSYAHKMITGRWEQMDTLRQLDGLSGFPKRSESPHDASDPGHSGTSLSIGLGYAVARKLQHKSYKTVAIIGDGALTSGVAIEALDQIGAERVPMIIILNDNEMSIDKNVGGFNTALQRMRTSSVYKKFKDSLKKVVSSPKGVTRLEAIRDSIKHVLLPENIFDKLGIKYYGPVDGHDMDSLINILTFVKDLDRPVVVHVLTTKGMGYAPAEDDPTRFHGIGPFDPKDPYVKTSSGETWSEAFGSELLDRAKLDEKICAISAAMIDSTGLSPMKEAFPDRVFDAGIAEQHAVSFAEGLALAGLKPVVAVYSTFLQRAYDEMITEVCLQKLPVVFAVDRAGATGADGETHQGIYDIAYLSSMPGMTIMCPRDKETLANMLDRAFALGTPCAIRYPRGKVQKTGYPAGNGDPQVLREGDDLIIISDGNMLDEAVKAAVLLSWDYGLSAAVADIGTIKPLNEDFVSSVLEKYSHVVVLEDGVVTGGLGSAFCSFAGKKGLENKILCLGWPDAFIEHGSIEQLRKRYGLDAHSITEKTAAFAGRQPHEKKA